MSPSGTASAPSCSAARRRTMCSSRAATCARSTVISPTCTPYFSSSCRAVSWWMVRSSCPPITDSTSGDCRCGCILRPRGSRSSRKPVLRRLLGLTCWPLVTGVCWTCPCRNVGRSSRNCSRASGAPYQPGKRAMFKIKHVRTADCVVAGFRWHKSGKGAVGSLLLGLYDDEGTLQHVGVTSAFTMAMRKQLVKELAPLRKDALRKHPWAEWADPQAESSRMPGGQSRWSAGKDLSWEPLRIERVCEVKYDHMEGDRF